jgi:predicted DNA-binding transcriptional regulator AlpA
MKTAVERKTRDDDRLLRVQDVAAQLAIAVRTCWKWVASGQLPRPLRLGSSIRWRQSDISRFIELGGMEDDGETRGGRRG